ncbi:MAG TPA: VCBS repeat-containing protein [Pirellulales bacterium]|nr:VCBS repeat-containing protein [Pirellulales bacterium]
MNVRSILLRGLPVLALLAALLAWPAPSRAYIEIPYALGRIVTESNYVIVLQVEKVEKTKNLIIYRKIQDLKGTSPAAVIKHQIGQNGYDPREWKGVMEWAEPGKIAIFFQKDGASEMCIDHYWYQSNANGEWWSMTHAEPFLLRSFCGPPEKMIPAVQTLIAGGEAVVPCMVDGDKMTLHLRTAKIQRLKASLKLQDYNPQRDFVGWGGEDLRAIHGMPGFAQYGAITRIDPEAIGVAPIDFDGDKKPDFLLYGANRISLVQNAGTTFNEVPLPYVGGARGAAWADYNGDGLPDLLLATPGGPRLLTNLGKGKFRDDTACLPPEALYHTTACAWIDQDGDGKPDILLANGYLGLRLYRNIVSVEAAQANAPPKLGPWKYIGPFDNPNGTGAYDTQLPPEKEIDLAKQYDGKGEKAVWKDGNFADGQVNNLRIFGQNENVVCYVERDIDCAAPAELPISIGSDDFVKVFLNGAPIHGENVARACIPDTTKLTLKLKAGKNHFLMKIGQGNGDWAFYFKPGEPEAGRLPLFADVSAQVGLGPNGLGARLKGDCLTVADVNGDGKPDFLFSAGSGLLALNTGKGFVEAKQSGIQFKAGKVTPLFADLTGGGYQDLLVPQGNACLLYKNDGRGHFTNVTAQAGDLRLPLRGAAGAVAIDASGHGKLDLFIACLHGPNHFLRNRGDGVFADASVELGLNQKVFHTRGLAALDLNHDGALDLILCNEGQDSAVLLGAKH